MKPVGTMSRRHLLTPRDGRAPTGEAAIPQKTYFRIGEVSELAQTKPYVLRFWETEFPTLSPIKSKTGHRLYRREDVLMVLTIKRLLYEEGFTIDGARKHLANNKTEKAGETPPAEARPTQPSLLEKQQLTAIKREIQSILTALARKC